MFPMFWTGLNCAWTRCIIGLIEYRLFCGWKLLVEYIFMGGHSLCVLDVRVGFLKGRIRQPRWLSGLRRSRVHSL